MRENQEDKIIYNNKKAYHDFFIEQTFESGIVVKGYEVKSIRKNGFNIKDSYCKIKNGEIYLIGSHISKYFFALISQPKSLFIPFFIMLFQFCLFSSI